MEFGRHKIEDGVSERLRERERERERERGGEGERERETLPVITLL